MTDIKIDTDVPFPEERGGTAPALYPFEKMEVGHSFFAPGKKRSQMDNAAGHWRKKKGWRFMIRETEENGIKGARVWRKE